MGDGVRRRQDAGHSASIAGCPGRVTDPGRIVTDSQGRGRMATRASARREIFDRSRALLARTRVVAAHLLDPPRHPVRKAIEAGPRVRVEPARDDALADVCASIALRDLNLIDTLLSELERMERSEEDSNRLGQLYRLDHLAARLRRNAENLRVLVDRDAGENAGDATSILDTVRAAMSSIDQYARISIG